eukprot:COSAG04_NODE_942_length_9261_cov_7.725278_6_plen_67_part_00
MGDVHTPTCRGWGGVYISWVHDLELRAHLRLQLLAQRNNLRRVVLVLAAPAKVPDAAGRHAGAELL